MTLDSPVQLTPPDREPTEKFSMTSTAESPLQSGSTSGGVEAPMPHGLEANTENAIPKPPNTTVMTQDAAESLADSKAIDGAAKEIISLAWRSYHHRRRKPYTVKT